MIAASSARPSFHRLRPDGDPLGVAAGDAGLSAAGIGRGRGVIRPSGRPNGVRCTIVTAGRDASARSTASARS